ncbi:MAG: long-chain-acyl-CoA synthetase, partial [Deltaproteobacteria bacterium]|nr:long-chain-acyl-CoA synthetase [Deltaproteobacteria bacterium]
KSEKELYLIDRKEWRKRNRAFVQKHQEDIIELQKMPLENKISWGSILERNARDYPNNKAILFEDTVLTYKEFNESVNRYANYFISLGLKKGDVVEILMTNRTELLILFSANAKIGAISSMINTELRKKTLTYCMNLTPGKFIVIGEERYNAFNDIKSELKLTDDQKLFFVPDRGEMAVPDGSDDLTKLVRDFSVDNPPTTTNVKTMDPIAYIFTSGTMGLPKAAIIPHYRILSNGVGFGALAAEFTTDDIIYICLPFFHATALYTSWSAAIATGGAVAVGRKFSVTRFWDEIRKYNATAFSYVGEICRYLMNQPSNPDDSNNTVKTVIGNGLRPEIWIDFKKRFNIPKIVEFYGSSEGNVGFVNLLNFDCTCGTNTSSPYAIVEYDIENDNPIRDENGRMKRVGIGETGLLITKSQKPFTFIGYTDKRETEAKLFRNVLKEGDVWFNTGDLVRDQGCTHIQFIDRLGDTFRWKGHNVSTTEVEEVLNVHDNILMSCVYGIELPLTDGQAGMVAIVPKSSVEDFDLKELTENIRQNLATYAIPIFLRFKSNLSITATFKFKKVKLKSEGFDIENVNDPLYMMLPGQSEYAPLTREIYDNIQNQKYKF